MAIMKNTNNIIYLIALLLIFPCGLSAQAVIGKEKVKDFPTDAPWIYPYESLDLNGNKIYLAHTPTVQMSEGTFIHLWKPENGFNRERVIRKYNLLAEELWELELELEKDEEIFHMYKHEGNLVLLSAEVSSFNDYHLARSRIIEPDSGKIIQSDILFRHELNKDQDLGFEISPDSSKFLFYYFQHENPNRGVRIYYDFVHWDEQVGFKASHIRKIPFIVFGNDLTEKHKGTLTIENKKLVTLDCQVDNEGNVYALSFEKPNQLQVRQYHAKSKEVSKLVYKDFVKYSDLNIPFYTQFPALVGQDEKIYITVAERVLKGRRRGTKAYKIISFDFKSKEIDLSREVPINSSLLVQLEKQREEFGMRPLKRFDEFWIRDLIEMPDQSLWLVIQKFGHGNLSGRMYENIWEGSQGQQELGEIILFQFDPQGDIQQAIIVTSQQYVNNFMERLGQFYFMDIDKQRGHIRLLTREPSLENLRGPDRLYYRFIDLNTSRVSDRLQIYDGKRRNQYFIKPYTVWMNPDILTFVIVEGDDGTAYVVTVNLQAEEEEDENRKWWQKARQ